MDEEYSMNNLEQDLEALIKAGLVEVAGITEDGEWLYGLTEEAREIMADLNSNPDKLLELVQIVEKVIDEQED